MLSKIQPLTVSALPRLRAQWIAAIAVSLLLAGLGALSVDDLSVAVGAATPPFARALALLGGCGAVATLILDRAILSPSQIARRVSIPDPALALRYLLAGHFALWSLAGIPALLGFAQLFLDGSLSIHLSLCAASLLVLAVLMPTQSRIAARLAAALR